MCHLISDLCQERPNLAQEEKDRSGDNLIQFDHIPWSTWRQALQCDWTKPSSMTVYSFNKILYFRIFFYLKISIGI